MRMTGESNLKCDWGRSEIPKQIRPEKLKILETNINLCGPDNSVGIVTGYGLDGLGMESRWGRFFFAHVQTGPGPYTASCIMGTGSFLGVKRPGCGADHSSPLSAEVKNE
jgi:hypothetical protein